MGNKRRHTPVRYPLGGVTTESVLEAYGGLGIPSPVRWHKYENDFDTYASGDWTLTQTGTGTVANTALNGGAVISTTTAGATDLNWNQLKAASFGLTVGTSSVAGLKSYFRALFKMADATVPAMIIGLTGTNTDPFGTGIQDGLYINKAAASTQMNVLNVVGGVVNNTIPIQTVLADGVLRDITIEYNGMTGNIIVYDSAQAETTETEASTGIDSRTSSVTVTTAVLNLSFGLKNGSAVAKSLAVDGLFVHNQRA